jgi:hypothetical protein
MAAAVLLTIGMSLIASGQKGGEQFFDNLWLATPMLGAGLSAVTAGAVAGFVVFFRRDRSALTFLVLLVGLLALLYVVGQGFADEQ